MRLRVGLFNRDVGVSVPAWLKTAKIPKEAMKKNAAAAQDVMGLQLERPSDVSALRSSFEYLGSGMGDVPNATIDRLAINHMGKYLLEASLDLGVGVPHVMYYKMASRQDGGANAVIAADYHLQFDDENGVKHTAIVRMSMFPETGDIAPPRELITTAGHRLPFTLDTFKMLSSTRYRGPSVVRHSPPLTFHPENLDRLLFASRGRKKVERSNRRWGLYEDPSVEDQPGFDAWAGEEELGEESEYPVGTTWAEEQRKRMIAGGCPDCGRAPLNERGAHVYCPDCGLSWYMPVKGKHARNRSQEERSQERGPKRKRKGPLWRSPVRDAVQLDFPLELEASVQPGHGLWSDLLKNVPHDVGNITESPEHDPDVERGDLVTQPDTFPDYGELEMDNEPQVDLLDWAVPRTVTTRSPYGEPGERAVTSSRKLGQGEGMSGGRLPSADSILSQEYGSSKNIMTPDVLEVGKIGLPDREQIIVYEIAEGTGMEQQPIFGVTIVTYDTSTGETARRTDETELFYSFEEARDHLRQFGEVYPETHVEVRERPEWKDEEYQGHPNWYSWNLMLWVDNEYDLYQARNMHGPFTARLARTFALDLLPGGTEDMDGPDDMERVDWDWVSRSWNEDLEELVD